MAVLVVFGLLSIWTVYTGYQQNKEIGKFTQPEPADLRVTYRDVDAVVAVRKRIREFGKSTIEGTEPSISLSVDDLNDLIGHEDRLFELRKVLAFTEIGRTVKARVALPLQTIFQGGRLRYLNATMDFHPFVEEGQPMLKIVALTPDEGGEVAEGFLNYLSDNYNFLAQFKEDKKLRPIFERVESITMDDGKVVVQAR